MKDLRTIILAAGKGTRMKSDTPKILHQICGQPILQFVLDLAKSIGSLKNYVILGHQIKKIDDFIGDRAIAIEQKQLLGTADAVKTAATHFRAYNGHVLILSGDAPLLRKETLKALVRRHKKTKAACSLVTAVVFEPQGYGRIVRGDYNSVAAIREERDATDFEKNIREINVGVYCFDSRQLFNHIRKVKLNPKKKEFYLTDIIELFIEEGLRVETVETEDPDEGLGINSRADLAKAYGTMRRRILENFMDNGVTVLDPDTTYVDVNVSIGKDTVIKPCTVIEQDVRIGRNCSIGPFARIRPGCRLKDNVLVGNFTEVSRSEIGSHTTMKHFSFLGDARVGTHVNIGAGAVTANYDGVNKNISKIQDHAFIGSDSILVAPVTIGKKATTGAGSVVVKKKVPDNKTIVGVPGRIKEGRKDT